MKRRRGWMGDPPEDPVKLLEWRLERLSRLQLLEQAAKEREEWLAEMEALWAEVTKGRKDG